MNEDKADTLTIWEAVIISLKAILILFLVVGLLMLCSCSTVKKSTTRTETKTDSTGTSSTETAKVVKTDSAGTKIETGNYEKTTVYAYDTIYYTEPWRTDTIIKYVPRIVTVYEKGAYNKSESAIKSNVDSGGVKQDKSGTVSKDIVQSSINKDKSSFPWWIIIVIVLAGGLYFSWKRYFK